MKCPECQHDMVQSKAGYLCLTCGHVGCCDNSPGKHATRHFHESGHPLIRSFEPGEDWGWCFLDELMLEPAPHARRT